MALLTLINPEFLDENIRKLKRMSIAGMPTLAFPKTMNSPPTPTRVRGIKGLREAAERGLLTGNGPHAGLLNWGRNVTLWGLPKMLDEKELYDDLQQFEFASDSKAQPNLVKVLPYANFFLVINPITDSFLLRPEGTFTMVSRFLITLEEAAEAHRFVHSIHYTYWKPQHYRTKYLMRARILY